MPRHLLAPVAFLLFSALVPAWAGLVQPGEPAAAAPARGPALAWQGDASGAAEVRFGPVGAARLDAARFTNMTGVAKRATQVGITQLAIEDGLTDMRPALTWKAVPGGQVAQMGVTAESALGVRVGVRLAGLPPGAELRAGVGARVEHALTVAEAQKQLDRNGLYWTPLTEGPRQRIELWVPGEGAARPVEVEAVSHFFALPRDKFAGAKASQACEVDVVCSIQEPGVDAASRGVAHMVYQEGSGSFICTGTLMNDTDAGSQVPYFHGAAHCIGDQSAASTLSTYWSFENAACGGANLPRSLSTAVHGGALLLHADADTDVLLLAMNQPPPASARYTGWDATALPTGTPITVIHHPDGDPKKISLGQALGIVSEGGASFWLTGYTRGTTEGGSSGSGLLTRSGNEYFLRGGLLGGDASCTNSGNLADPNNRDYFSRFDQAFPILRNWLAEPVSRPANDAFTGRLVLPATQARAYADNRAAGSEAGEPVHLSGNAGKSLWWSWTAPQSGSVVMSTAGSDFDSVLSVYTGTVLAGLARIAENDDAVGTTSRVTFDAVAGTTYQIAVSGYRNGTGGVAGGNIRLSVTQGMVDYSDLWWLGPAEDGWGMTVQQHGLVQFNVLYVYDNAGRPAWYVMPGGSWNAGFTRYTGALYKPVSSPLNIYNAAQFVPGAPVGTLAIDYTSASTATLEYTINGVSGTKRIQRQLFGPADNTPGLAVGDMWWAGIQQDGWGVSITQQFRTLFAAWFTYDPAGNGTWFVMPGGSWSGNTYTGQLAATTSSPWLGATYNPSQFAPTIVGTVSFAFQDANRATMTYSFTSGPFAGVTQVKEIVRQPY